MSGQKKNDVLTGGKGRFTCTSTIKTHLKYAEMLAIVVHENMKLGDRL